MADRGATTALNYALLLGIVSILASTLVFGVGGVVTDQQERTVQSQLTVVGNGFANDLSTVGRLARTADDRSVELSTELPERAVGARYSITIDRRDVNRYRLELRSSEVVVHVAFHSPTPIDQGGVRGGQVVIRYEPESGEVVVDGA